VAGKGIRARVAENKRLNPSGRPFYIYKEATSLGFVYRTLDDWKNDVTTNWMLISFLL
jgi:hypothetical protein